ncbi:MAG: hypothetical protein WA771_16100 [Chthoniobacterales bacterium]
MLIRTIEFGVLTGQTFKMSARPSAIVFACLLLVTIGCDGDQNALRREILAAQRQHVEALPAGDIDAALTTIHPESASLDEARLTVDRLAQIGVEFTLENSDVVSVGDGTAVAGFVILARGPDSFRDHRLTGQHELRLDDRDWKVFATQIERLEYLDDSRSE